MNTLINDLRYGLRMLWRNPGFSAIALVTLALGIGANTAIFSVVNAVLLRPLPYPDADRIVWITDHHEEIASRWVSYPNFLDWHERNHAFESMATVRGWQMTLTGDEAESINARMVTAEYFRVMGVPPIVGRDFSSESDKYGSENVTILSNQFWKSKLGGDPGIVNKRITLNNRPFTVIGVMPKGFQYPSFTQLWILTEQYAEPGSAWFTGRDVRVAGNVVARLAPGVTIEQARSEMKAIEEELSAAYPMQNAGNTVRIVTLQESIVGSSRQSLLLLFGAVGVVLLIACANVANLILARSATRQKEFAVRAALGARGRHLIRLLLTESLILAVLGGCLGLLVANWSTALLIQLAPDAVPRLEGATLGWKVFFFTQFLSILTGVAFGLVPAFQSVRTDLIESLKDGARSSSDSRSGRLRSAFVVAEIALSMVLLAGAGLLVRSMARVLSSDPGFNPERVVTMQVLPREAYQGGARLIQFHAELLERVSSLPGVESACVLNDDLPGFDPGWQNDINPEINGSYLKIKPGELINCDWGIVSEGYFATMRIPIEQGRTFTADEVRRGANVVVIDSQLARKFWPAGDALGRHIKYDATGPQEIVGIAGDVRTYGNTGLGRIKIYTPFGHAPVGRSTLAVRSSGPDPAGLVGSVKEAVRSINNAVPVWNVATLDAQLSEQIASRRFSTWLLGLFAMIALVLASIGIYGVMSYSVIQRTRELGIRFALGAQKRDVMKMTIFQSLRLVLAGLALGLPASLLITRSLRGLLYGVSSNDPVTLVSITFLLTAVALLACWIPARRASRVDPMVALRHEG